VEWGVRSMDAQKHSPLDGLLFCFQAQIDCLRREVRMAHREKGLQGTKPSQKETGSNATRARYCRTKHVPLHTRDGVAAQCTYMRRGGSKLRFRATSFAASNGGCITVLIYHTTTGLRHVGCGHKRRRARRCTCRSRAIADECRMGLAVWKHSVSRTSLDSLVPELIRMLKDSETR
jgi:hypothetical protein